jgi:predicted kinase
VAQEVILVNGLPGSGKTTLGSQLSQHLDVPFLSKDRIKEALADAVSAPVRGAALGGVAMDAVWMLAAAIPGCVVIDSWWFRPRDLQFAYEGLVVAKAEAIVEIWCDVPIALARARYDSRQRSSIHQDDRDMSAEWEAWASEGIPLAICPVIRIDTTVAVDASSLIAQINAVSAAR